MTYKKFRLKVGREYKTASGYKIKIISKFKNKNGKTRFVGEINDSNRYDLVKYKKRGDSLGAPNDVIYCDTLINN